MTICVHWVRDKFMIVTQRTWEYVTDSVNCLHTSFSVSSRVFGVVRAPNVTWRARRYCSTPSCCINRKYLGCGKFQAIGPEKTDSICLFLVVFGWFGYIECRPNSAVEFCVSTRDDGHPEAPLFFSAVLLKFLLYNVIASNSILDTNGRTNDVVIRIRCILALKCDIWWQ